MNKNEIYSKIRSGVEDLKQKDSEEKKEKQWVLLVLGKEEYLICDICGRSMHNEITYINIPNVYKRVLCKDCWKDNKGVKE